MDLDDISKEMIPFQMIKNNFGIIEHFDKKSIKFNRFN